MGAKSAASPTIQQRVKTAIGEESVETVLYAEEQNTLTNSHNRWRKFETLDTLPDQPLDGWEELVVFTETYVYRWVEMGFSSGPQRTPEVPRRFTKATSYS